MLSYSSSSQSRTNSTTASYPSGGHNKDLRQVGKRDEEETEEALQLLSQLPSTTPATIKAVVNTRDRRSDMELAMAEALEQLENYSPHTLEPSPMAPAVARTGSGTAKPKTLATPTIKSTRVNVNVKKVEKEKQTDELASFLSPILREDEEEVTALQDAFGDIMTTTSPAFKTSSDSNQQQSEKDSPSTTSTSSEDSSNTSKEIPRKPITANRVPSPMSAPSLDVFKAPEAFDVYSLPSVEQVEQSATPLPTTTTTTMSHKKEDERKEEEEEEEDMWAYHRQKPQQEAITSFWSARDFQLQRDDTRPRTDNGVRRVRNTISVAPPTVEAKDEPELARAFSMVDLAIGGNRKLLETPLPTLITPVTPSREATPVEDLQQKPLCRAQKRDRTLRQVNRERRKAKSSNGKEDAGEEEDNNVPTQKAESKPQAKPKGRRTSLLDDIDAPLLKDDRFETQKAHRKRKHTGSNGKKRENYSRETSDKLAASYLLSALEDGYLPEEVGYAQDDWMAYGTSSGTSSSADSPDAIPNSEKTLQKRKKKKSRSKGKSKKSIDGEETEGETKKKRRRRKEKKKHSGSLGTPSPRQEGEVSPAELLVDEGKDKDDKESDGDEEEEDEHDGVTPATTSTESPQEDVSLEPPRKERTPEAEPELPPEIWSITLPAVVGVAKQLEVPLLLQRRLSSLPSQSRKSTTILSEAEVKEETPSVPEQPPQVHREKQRQHHQEVNEHSPEVAPLSSSTTTKKNSASSRYKTSKQLSMSMSGHHAGAHADEHEAAAATTSVISTSADEEKIVVVEEEAPQQCQEEEEKQEKEDGLLHVAFEQPTTDGMATWTVESPSGLKIKVYPQPQPKPIPFPRHGS